MIKKANKKLRSFITFVCIVAGGILINVLLSKLVSALNIRIYLDSAGTFIAAMLGGPFAAVVVGFSTNTIAALSESSNIYFGLINVLIAVAAAICFRSGVYKSVWKTVVATLSIAVGCALLSSVLMWFLFGFDPLDGSASWFTVRLYETGAFGEYPSLLFGEICTEIIDKSVTVILALALYYIIPKSLRNNVYGLLNQKVTFVNSGNNMRSALMLKVIVVVLLAETILGTIASFTGYYVYREIAIRYFTDVCSGAADSALTVIDADHVETYLAEGRESEGYLESESRLYGIKDAFPDIAYLYAYKIEPDGCHVVFDLDSEGLEASDVGEIVQFDESFEKYLPTLLAGGEIEPIITDDTYGWLLTVYKPVIDSDGKCVCYVACDIKIDSIITDETAFIVKLNSLFLGASIILIVIIVELLRRSIIYPINSMASEAGNFTLDIEKSSTNSIEHLKELNIHSKDEIENLHLSLVKLAEDSMLYVEELRQKSHVITRMQEDIIYDLADMVEARDKCTGDHIKKTSFYVSEIAKEMKREGKYPDIMTDEFISNIKRFAPLHDIGKIAISDVILNKPGRLTEEEFEIMKTHTIHGQEILTRTNSHSDTGGYLKEAVEMAAFHHERWDGSGYPYRLRGEEIPLSARIMAVADVFDALVSRRSYKEPFSYEKAIEIIKEESGTHFDPVVVDAFLNISDRAYYHADEEI